MDHDKKYVRVPGKLFVEQVDEFVRRFTVVHRQRTADSQHASLFSHLCGDGGDHRTLEARNALPAVSLLREADGFLRC